MDRTPSGSAALKHRYEEHFIKLELDRTGHVGVRGELMDFSSALFQKLVFAFETDQTCLAPLIKDFKQWRGMPAGRS